MKLFEETLNTSLLYLYPIMYQILDRSINFLDIIELEPVPTGDTHKIFYIKLTGDRIGKIDVLPIGNELIELVRVRIDSLRSYDEDPAAVSFIKRFAEGIRKIVPNGSGQLVFEEG